MRAAVSCLVDVAWPDQHRSRASTGCIDKREKRFVEFRAFGPLAQLVEQLTLNQRVAGSSPARLILKSIT